MSTISANKSLILSNLFWQQQPQIAAASVPLIHRLQGGRTRSWIIPHQMKKLRVKIFLSSTLEPVLFSCKKTSKSITKTVSNSKNTTLVSIWGTAGILTVKTLDRQEQNSNHLIQLDHSKPYSVTKWQLLIEVWSSPTEVPNSKRMSLPHLSSFLVSIARVMQQPSSHNNRSCLYH